MRICVIANPNSGTADGDALEQAVKRLGDVTVRTTEQPGDAKRFAEEAVASGFDMVIAAGGDGTLNEVVNGLAADFSRSILGLIPLGTGNDFARTLEIPNDIDAAVDTIAAGMIHDVDIVRVTSDKARYFINVSSGGFSGLVDEKLTDEMKQNWGPLAYLRSAAEALPDLSEYHMSIVFDDAETLNITTFSIIVANARFVAGGIPIAPKAIIDDGLVDVLLIPAASMSELALLVPQILLGMHQDSELVTVRRVRKIKIDSHPGMWFNTDGELVGNEPATFEVLPRALRVIVHAQPAE
ncbi:MAG TPA: diacylglycerol kinase family protein [Roseiflexaceae bacterium]|nr:diacylglycerol kinase family protein [Roseiflexaceae bacterium]